MLKKHLSILNILPKSKFVCFLLFGAIYFNQEVNY